MGVVVHGEVTLRMREYAVREKPRGGFELWSWFFMRISGILLLFLALGHLGIMHIVHNVEEISYQFVAERFATPFWRWYDFFLLGLALFHGTNGVRIIIDDYAKTEKQRKMIWLVLKVTAGLLFIGGAWVLLCFNPPLQ
jgi:succinate dehydrogenase / fumarate reductase, membrane anchor subunit